jgi:Plasmid pRiA4b ORF-3-like protein
MSEPSSIIDVYQLHVWLREITPLIWRRLLVRSDSTIADLHYTL